MRSTHLSTFAPFSLLFFLLLHNAYASCDTASVSSTDHILNGAFSSPTLGLFTDNVKSSPGDVTNWLSSRS